MGRVEEICKRLSRTGTIVFGGGRGCVTLVGAVRAMPFANVHHIIIVSRMGWR